MHALRAPVTLTDLAHLAATAPGVALVLVVAVAVLAYQKGWVHSDREFTRLEEENAALRAENTGLRSALSAERQTANVSTGAVQVNNQLLEALVGLAADRRGLPAPKPIRPDFPTPEDLSL